MSRATYSPGDQAVVNARVSYSGQQEMGAPVAVSFFFPDRILSCPITTDQSGMGSCSIAVPNYPDGTKVQVSAQAVGPNKETAIASTSFTITNPVM
jgi:hypothetical protein